MFQNKALRNAHELIRIFEFSHMNDIRTMLRKGKLVQSKSRTKLKRSRKRIRQNNNQELTKQSTGVIGNSSETHLINRRHEDMAEEIKSLKSNIREKQNIKKSIHKAFREKINSRYNTRPNSAKVLTGFAKSSASMLSRGVSESRENEWTSPVVIPKNTNNLYKPPINQIYNSRQELPDSTLYDGEWRDGKPNGKG